jgi:hypothetical protein
MVEGNSSTFPRAEDQSPRHGENAADECRAYVDELHGFCPECAEGESGTGEALD